MIVSDARMFQYLHNITSKIHQTSCKIPKAWNAALASMLLTYVKNDLLYQLLRLDSSDGIAMLRKIKSLCVPCTPQDINVIQTKLWTLQMKEDESAIKFLFRFRKFQEQLDIHGVHHSEDALINHLLNILMSKPG